MTDPLAQIVALLRPRAIKSKISSGAGFWSIRRPLESLPFYCSVLEGSCRLAITGHTPLILEAGDFVLVPAAVDFAMSSLVPPPGDEESRFTVFTDGEVRHGEADGPADVRLLLGLCAFQSPDAALLQALLPGRIHIRSASRLAAIIGLIVDEARERRAAREPVLERLLEVLVIEALRSSVRVGAEPGLLSGLADERLAAALRLIHGDPAADWTIAKLAKAAALSRSAFFDRFRRVVGVPPMDYLLAWRMAVARDLLGYRDASVGQVAAAVGYSTANTFSVAFARHTGVSPTHYLKARSQALPAP